MEHNKEETDTTVGFSNWKKASTTCDAHQISKAHESVLACESLIQKCGDIAEITVSQLQKKTSWRTKILIRIMKYLSYLARQG